jgi:hypothetical protein
MSKTETIRIPANKKRIPFMLILFSGITFSLVYYLYGEFATDGFRGLYANLFSVVLLLAMLFYFSTFLVEYLKPFISKSAGILLTPESMRYDLGTFAAGNIPWEEITGISIISKLNSHFLLIKIKDPDKFIAGKPKWKQMILTGFARKSGTPVIISSQRIDYDMEELKNLILNYVTA